MVEELSITTANADVPNNANWSRNEELRALISRLLSENWPTFIIRPNLPPLKTGKCLVPGFQLDFELSLNPNTIYLMGAPNKGTLNTKKFPAIHNEDITVTLLMRKVTLNASVYVRLQKERQMLKKIVRYPVVRSEIRTFSFDGRATQWEKDNVFVGRFSDRVMVGLLHSNAFNGDLGRYPYAFQTFGVTQVRQSLNGEEYPYRTLELTGDPKPRKICWGTIGFYKPWVPTMKTRFSCCSPVTGDRGTTAGCLCSTMCPVAKPMTPSIATPVNRAMCDW